MNTPTLPWPRAFVRGTRRCSSGPRADEAQHRRRQRHLVASETAWRSGEIIGADRDAAKRRRGIGFDPLAEPSRSTYPWAAEFELLNDPRAFIARSYMENPSGRQLPLLNWPAVRDVSAEVSPAAAYYLEQFALESTAEVQ